MAVWSIIESKELDAAARHDAEYFQPENLRKAATLAKANPKPISAFADVTDGIHASPEWVTTGIPYLSAKCVREHYIALDAAGQISVAQDAANPRTRARAGDVIVTSVGTIGNAAVIEPNMLPANMDRHLGIIRIRDPRKVDPYYLATFLNCEFGRFQTQREATGNVQLNLFIEKIRGLQVPLDRRLQQAGAIAREGCEALRKAERYYPEAETELLERINWEKLKKQPVALSYMRDFGDITAAERADPEFFRPQPHRVRTWLVESGARSIADICHFVEHGLQPPYVVEGTIGIVSQRQFRTAGLDLELLENFTDASFSDDNAKFRLRRGDVLTYCVSAGDYLGRTFLFDSDIPCVAASFVTILRTKQIVPGYLALFLNCAAGLIQSNMFKRGTSPFYLYPRDLKQVLIYLPRQKDGALDLAWQQKLADKVETAVIAKAAARAKLEEAKRLIENAIR